jgi:hypothetical protein
MDFHTLLFHIARLPAVSVEAFEQALRAKVMPAIDTGQTRAGRIVSATLYRTTNGHYRLLIDVETMTGSSWALGRLQPARDEIGEIGVIYAEDDMQRVTDSSETLRGP